MYALGRPAEALGELRHALHIAIELGQRYAIADAIDGVAGALAAAGAEESAAELLGTVAVVRAEMARPAS